MCGSGARKALLPVLLRNLTSWMMLVFFMFANMALRRKGESASWVLGSFLPGFSSTDGHCCPRLSSYLLSSGSHAHGVGPSA